MRFPIELLNKWKCDAVGDALRSLASPAAATRQGPMRIQLDDADKAWLQALALPPDNDIESTTDRMRKAAVDDITAFQDVREWPPHVVTPNLRLLGTETSSITLDGLARGIGTSEGVCLVSPPGTGKTTTLVQLAESILRFGEAVAVLV
jgi:replicative DNA helicase